MWERDPKSLRILHFADRSSYGPASSMAQLAAAQARNGNDVSVVLLCRSGRTPPSLAVDQLTQQRVPLRTISIRQLRPWMRPKLLARLLEIPAVIQDLKAQGFDVLHCHSPSTCGFGWAAARRAKVPVVATWHGSATTRTLRKLFEHLDGLAVLSKDQEEKFRQRTPPGYVRLLRNGIDVRKWRDQLVEAQDLRSTLEIHKSAFVVGFAGRLSPEKGLSFLLLALADGGLRDPDEVCLLVAGDGPLAAQLRSDVHALDLEAATRFLGRIEYMPSFYRTIDLLVVPSLRETQPMVILEAMASEVPVVGTAVGDIPTMLGGEAGIVIPAQQAQAILGVIESLKNNPQQRARIIRNGLLRVRQRYDNAVVADLYLEKLYLPILAKCQQPV